MANPTRYYITRDDGRPVVRTIPVTVRKAEATNEVPLRDEKDVSTVERSPSPTRVARLVRSAVRRAPSGR